MHTYFKHFCNIFYFHRCYQSLLNENTDGDWVTPVQMGKAPMPCLDSTQIARPVTVVLYYYSTTTTTCQVLRDWSRLSWGVDDPTLRPSEMGECSSLSSTLMNSILKGGAKR